MTTRDNRPATETPDWSPCAGNRCGGCDSSANLCHVTLAITDATCCRSCEHRASAGTNVRELDYPQVWLGED